MKRFIGLLLLCLMTIFSSAQIFKGTVVDDAGNPVPHAALYLRETKSGFTTDEHGRFRTNLAAGVYTCEVSSLGFVSQSFSFRMSGHDYEKNVVLTERIYSLPEVNVTKNAEDPAYAVIRKAIARASYYRTLVKEFTAGTYLKGTGKGTSIPGILKLSKEIRKESKESLGKLFLMEEQQVITFKAPNIWSKRVVARKNSFPESVQIDLGLTTVNFYAPEIFGRISPLNKNAFSYYRFRLDGYFMENGRMINKIRVIPKKPDVRLLEGDWFIVEDLWSVSAANAEIRGNGMKATIKVICQEVQPSIFLPVSTTSFTSIDVMGFKAEASYLAAVHYTSVKTELNQDVRSMPHVAVDNTTAVQAKKTMERRKHKYERPAGMVRANTEVDSLADKKDSLYWATVRSVPLKPDEQQSYQYKEQKMLQKDSLDKKSPHKQNVLGGIVNTFLFGRTFATSDKKAWITFPGLPAYVPEYNFVDGFWLGVRLKMGIDLSPSSSLRFTPFVYYATACKNWMGQGELVLNYAPRNRGRLTLAGGFTSADYNGESGESRLINALSSSLFGHNHVKLYEKTFFTVSHEIEPLNGLLFSSSLSWQRRQMVENRIHHNWFKKAVEENLPANDDFRPMPENDVLKTILGMVYTPAYYYHMSKGRKVYEDSRYPTFALKYERAFPLKGGRYLTSYHLIQFSAKQEVNFGMFNRLFWMAEAGMLFDKKNVQFPDFKHFASTDIPVTERSFDAGFNLMGNYALSTNTRWTQVNMSWYTPYLILKRLPFLSDKFFDEALHLRTIAIFKRKPYSELGYSIGLSTVGRVGVFVGVDCPKFRAVGISFSLPLLRSALK